MTIVGGRELTVGQLSARAGVAVSTLHFYEAKGLIRSRRTSGNQRRYPRDTLRRIAFIRIAQRVGIPLATIGEALASLPENRTPTAADWAALSAVFLRPAIPPPASEASGPGLVPSFLGHARPCLAP